jgi:hypothetical protein
MWGAPREPRPPTFIPITQGPPGPTPCKPTLLLSLPDFVLNALDQLLINDLIYSNHPLNDFAPDVQHEMLKAMDGPTLVQLVKSSGKGSVILPDDELFTEGTDQVDTEQLARLATNDYQAIVVDDTCFIREPDVQKFVMQQYQEKNVSVVIVGAEGIYDLGPIRAAFGVDWNVTVYTRRTIQLNPLGSTILGRQGFAVDTNYVKALFIQGTHELFMEHVNPDDYEPDSDDEDPQPPKPQPGSPVTTFIEHGKSVSYFGFVNSSDVSYGAIILRLCYAAYHQQASSSSSSS